MPKVLITTVPFGAINRLPLDLLENANIEYVINPLNKKLTEGELLDLITDFDAVIAGTEEITESVMIAATKLKLISRVGIGLDSVDLLAAEKLNIGVSYTPDAPAPAVTDLTMGLMYSLLRKIHEANLNMHDGNWRRFFGKRLVDCTVGIIGAGRVGSGVIKNLKAIMKRSYDQNYHTNIYPMTSAFKKTSSESITVYLTKKELDQLINYNLSDRLHLDRLRDIFVVGTMIAQRYGDYSDIDQSNIHVDDHGKKTIRLIQNKGRNKVIVPMSGVVERVLSKYENKLPKSNVNSLNYAIKDICKELGITQTIEVMENRGGKEVIRNVQKYELVGSHTARRTGCTLMYLNGIPTIDIMKISGHKTESELLKYIRVTKEETAQRLSLNPFFNSSLKVV